MAKPLSSHLSARADDNREGLVANRVHQIIRYPDAVVTFKEACKAAMLETPDSWRSHLLSVPSKKDLSRSRQRKKERPGLAGDRAEFEPPIESDGLIVLGIHH